MSTTNQELRPGEKRFGQLLTLGLCAGLGYGLYLALPALLAFAWGLVSLSIAGGILFALGTVVTHDQTRNLLALAYRVLVRNLSRAFIRHDPISVAKDYVIMLQKKLQKAVRERAKLRAVLTRLQETIAALRKEFEQSANMTRAAEKMGDKKTKIIQGNLSKMTGEAIVDLEARMARLLRCDELIGKLIENDEMVIAVTENNVRILNIRFDAAKAAGDAFDAAYSISQQDPETRAAYDIACEEASKIITERMGMMDMLVDSTSGLIRNIDVNNAAIDDTALAQIEAFEARLLPDQQEARRAPEVRIVAPAELVDSMRSRT